MKGRLIFSRKLVQACMLVLAVTVVAGLSLWIVAASDASVPRTEAVLRTNAEIIENNLSQLEEQQAAERESAHKELELPKGYEFSSPVSFPEVEAQSARLNKLSARASHIKPQQVPETEISVYEEGYFESIAAIDWQCAWLSVAVTASENGDSSRVQDAVARLERFQDTRLAQAFPDYPIFLSDYVRPVLNGQLGNARDFLGAGCTLPASQ